jgi:hypothetical protein
MPKTISDVKVVSHESEPGTIVRITPFIGHGQEGAWSIHLDDKFLDHGTAPKEVRIGKAEELVGSNVEVSAVMKDGPQSDKLSLLLELSAGKTEPRPVIENVAAPGDSADYSIIVKLF